MRRFINSLAVMLAISSYAFDSDAWLGKCERLRREAAELKARYARAVQAVEQPAVDVLLPFANHPDGSVKSKVFAKKAQFFLKENLIWGEGVTITDTRQDGSEIARAEAENCIVDRTERRGWVEGHAKTVSERTVLDGDQVFLSFTNEFVSVASNAVLVASGFNNSKNKNATSLTKVRAQRADYDRREGVILLEGKVRLDDAEYQLAADRAFVFLEGTNALKRVVAMGAVAVTNGLRHGSCDRVVYSRATAKVTMYGAEHQPATLSDEGERKAHLEGRRIIFWLDSEQTEVEQPRITVAVPASGKTAEAQWLRREK